ncbi:MAG: hypothetical protein WDN24_02000 [Sphingomonas sp.]
MAWRWRWPRTRAPAGLQRGHDLLVATRPTAINLRWALDSVRDAVKDLAPGAARRSRLRPRRRHRRRGCRHVPRDRRARARAVPRAPCEEIPIVRSTS